MSLSVKYRVQLGDWGTLGLIGHNHVQNNETLKVYFLLQVDCKPEEYQSHIATMAWQLAEQNFCAPCTWLWPCADEQCHRLLFSWNINSHVRTPKRLVMAAARRFKDAEQRGKQSFAEELADIATHRNLQLKGTPYVVTTFPPLPVRG